LWQLAATFLFSEMFESSSNHLYYTTAEKKEDIIIIHYPKI